jgi:hypothetical protein
MIRVNAERLWSTLEMMAQIGGTPAGGVTRLALSEEDRIARNLLRDWALDAGFTCDVDSMGNMFIRRAGKNPQLAPADRFTWIPSRWAVTTTGFTACWPGWSCCEPLTIITLRPSVTLCW